MEWNRVKREKLHSNRDGTTISDKQYNQRILSNKHEYITSKMTYISCMFLLHDTTFETKNGFCLG